MTIRLLPLLSLLACAGDKDSGATATPPPGTASLVDANNYRFDGSLQVPSIETASGVDITVDWSAVVDDIQCHGVDPAADIDTVGLVRFGTLTQEELAQGLSDNDLDQSQMSGYVQYANDGGTSTNLASMSFFGTVIDVPSEYVEGEGSYLLLLSTGDTIGLGARMLAFLDPKASSSNTLAASPSGCGVLDFEVELEALTRVSLLASGPYALDWSALTLDGQGNPIDTSGIDSVMLGYYEGGSAADLEAGFLDLELDATELYTLALTGGTTADLAAATTADGAPFAGFHTGGEWVLALRCSRCYNPAPPFVSLVLPYYEAG